MRNMKRLLSMLLCLCLTVSLLAACGGGGDNGGGGSGGQKDTLIIARPYDSDTLDPVTNSLNQDIWVLENIAEGLVCYSDDGTEVEPLLATDWTYDEASMTWTFNLREGLKFSDGSDVTAEDIEFSFQRCIDHTESIHYTYAAQIESVECPDDTTVIFHIKAADPAFLTNLCMPNMKIISKAYFDENGGEDGVADGVMGTGPYAIGEWDKGEQLTLVRNEYYWEEGLPKTDTVIFRNVPEAESRAMMLQAGEIDVDTEVPIASMADLDAVDGITAEPVLSTRTKYFNINHRHEPFDDVRVREAFRCALDLQEIVDIVMLGNAEVANSYINPVGKYYDADLPYPEQDIDRAKELLAEAGYPDGFEFDYLVVSGNSENEQIATVAKEQLAEAGIIANIFQVENSAMLEMFDNNQITVYTGQWTLESNDPAALSDYWWIYDQSDAYISGYQNERLTEINQLAKTEMDDTIRGQYFTEMQETYYNDVVAIPIFYAMWTNAWRDGVEDFIQSPYGIYRLKYCTVIE